MLIRSASIAFLLDDSLLLAKFLSLFLFISSFLAVLDFHRCGGFSLVLVLGRLLIAVASLVVEYGL